MTMAHIKVLSLQRNAAVVCQT